MGLEQVSCLTKLKYFMFENLDDSEEVINLIDKFMQQENIKEENYQLKDVIYDFCVNKNREYLERLSNDK